MFQTIIALFRPKISSYPFNNEFINGYRKSYINNIKNYTP